jgi:hypothetical protein
LLKVGADDLVSDFSEHPTSRADESIALNRTQTRGRMNDSHAVERRGGPGEGRPILPAPGIDAAIAAGQIPPSWLKSTFEPSL